MIESVTRALIILVTWIFRPRRDSLRSEEREDFFRILSDQQILYGLSLDFRLHEQAEGACGSVSLLVGDLPARKKRSSQPVVRKNLIGLRCSRSVANY
jgi:hypothetical protein